MIDILCPSRGRPGRFREMLESALATASRPDHFRVHLVVDADDETRGEYPSSAAVLTHVNEERGVPGPVLLQRAAARATLLGATMLFIGADDIVFRTPGWDRELARVLDVPGPMAVAPNDGSGKEKWTHFAVNRRWLEVVGHLTPAFEHFCVDTYVERIAKLAGAGAYLNSVLIEHRHKKYDRALNDATYAAKRQRAEDGSRPSDRDEAMLEHLQPQIAELAEKVRTA